MQLNVYDMDGTMVDSTAALRQCQAEGMYRATGRDLSELESILAEKGLKGALAYLNIDQDTFFRTHYKTFDPYEAAKKGMMNVFADASNDLDIVDRMGCAETCLISNSTIDATLRKLDAVNLKDRFNYVFAEVEKDKAKPTPYMANQLRDRLVDDGKLQSVKSLLTYGDQPIDMEFGEVLHEVLSSAKGKDIAYRNHLIDRDNKFSGMSSGSLLVVPSLYYTFWSKIFYSGAK